MTELLILASLWLTRAGALLDGWNAWPDLIQAPPFVLEEPTEVLTLQNGSVVENLSGKSGSLQRFTLTVPQETARLEIHLNGGRGDADLYVKSGNKPDLFSFDYRPFVQGNTESLWIDHPVPGTWHVLIHGHREYDGATLQVFKRAAEQQRLDEPLLTATNLDLSLYFELSGIPLPEENLSRELRNQILRDEGRLAFTNGNYDRAISLWTQWRDLDPANPEPVSLIGDVYLRLGDTERAVNQYRQSLKIQPGQITLMVRLARLIDVQLGQPAEARSLLNLYSRIFPYHTGIALAQAEWLVRRNRLEEATRLVDAVIEHDPENLQARTLLHGFLRSNAERFENLQAILDIGERPGQQELIARAFHEHQFMTRPESWRVMDFIDRMRFEAPTRAQRNLFAELMPREETASENFRLGRMSQSWISSEEQQWNEDGNLILSADPRQTEAYLRLDRSDTMQNGFIEAKIEATRGFFWLYARRGQGNMIRFGFDDSGLMYQQIWINGHLTNNQQRLWSRAGGTATLRLEVRADGVFTSVDGRPAFSSPMTIPKDMGLGWWGVAPWAPDFGRAAVTLRQISGGPLPARFGLMPPDAPDPQPTSRGHSFRRAGLALRPAAPLRSPRRTDQELNLLQERIRHLSMLAPEWYRVNLAGRPVKRSLQDDIEVRLLSRFYRVRLLPALRYRHLETIPWEVLSETARRDRLDGFTLMLPKMPDPDAIRVLEETAFSTGLDFVLMVSEPEGTHFLLREIKAGVSLLPGARRAVRVPVHAFPKPEKPDRLQHQPAAMILNL